MPYVIYANTLITKKSHLFGVATFPLTVKNGDTADYFKLPASQRISGCCQWNSNYDRDTIFALENDWSLLHFLGKTILQYKIVTVYSQFLAQYSISHMRIGKMQKRMIQTECVGYLF